MKYTVICGKTVLLTDEQFRAYRKHQNRERYIFGKQEWKAKVYQLEYLPFQLASDYTVEEEFDRAETAEKLWSAMAALRRFKPEYFEIVNLRILEGRSIKEISEEFGISETAVAKKFKRAIGILRNYMEDNN